MNRDYFTQPLQSDRLAHDYGNTHLGADEARSPWFWVVGGLVFFMLLWAVVS
jgi:hypothetical protein